MFDRNGKFLRMIGKTGTGPGEFRTPHAIEFDSQGRLDGRRSPQPPHPDPDEGREVRRANSTSSAAPAGSRSTRTTSSTRPTRNRPSGCIQAGSEAIRIGSLKDGKVTIFVPPHDGPNSPDGAMGEGIAIDAAGNVFTAEAQLRGVTKYVKGSAN